jgi:radical SAM protein with 4Fe4S-binding SPASM domain
MLKFDFSKNSEEFVIDFDVPLEKGINKYREKSKLLRFFEENGNYIFEYNEKQQLKKISGNINSFINNIDNLLPPKEYIFQKDIMNNFVKRRKKKEEDRIEVNFHQKPFDTSRRYWNFIWNQGKFDNLFLNRINWYIAPKNAIVTPFPLHVDLESASTCNMNCPMCYRDQMKDSGEMDLNVFKKAVDECAENNVFSVRLSWRGETLTHPKIKEMIAYATSKIKNVSFLTNAFYLDESMIDCFIKSKVSYISVSFDGIGEIYERIRHPAKFKENYDKLAMLRDRKRELKSNLPQVRICTIWPAIKDDPDAYYYKMKEVSDYIVCNPYINFKGEMKIKPDFICQYPWERIVIGFNGDSQCCTGWNADDIILGNVKEKSIFEMWHGSLMNKIRKFHAEGRRMEISSCADCRHGSEGDPDVDIRSILKRKF